MATLTKTDRSPIIEASMRLVEDLDEQEAEGFAMFACSIVGLWDGHEEMRLEMSYDKGATPDHVAAGYLRHLADGIDPPTEE